MPAQFLLYLQQFSDKLLGRTQEVNARMDDLMREVKAADLRVHNTFNAFLMLANDQFVENVRAAPPVAAAA